MQFVPDWWRRRAQLISPEDVFHSTLVNLPYPPYRAVYAPASMRPHCERTI